jgi:hypothetical protein
LTLDYKNNILYTSDGYYNNNNIYKIELDSIPAKHGTVTTICDQNITPLNKHFAGSIYVNDSYYTNTLFIADPENGGNIYSYHN